MNIDISKDYFTYKKEILKKNNNIDHAGGYQIPCLV